MNWDLTLSAFVLVFLAELGDKSQLTVIAQSYRYHSPLSVFFGAGAALTLVTAIGVTGGDLLGHLIPQLAVRAAAAAAFIITGLYMCRESSRLIQPGNSEVNAGGENGGEVERDPPLKLWSWKAFNTTFPLLLLAELGDKTQLAVAGLAMDRLNPVSVFAGSAAALIALTALGVILGHQLGRVMPRRRLLLRISASIFILIGILIGTGLI